MHESKCRMLPCENVSFVCCLRHNVWCPAEWLRKRMRSSAVIYPSIVLILPLSLLNSYDDNMPNIPEECLDYHIIINPVSGVGSAPKCELKRVLLSA